MFRRALSVLSNLNGGSMRKRLYVRLAAFAFLLAAGVIGIGEAQKYYNKKRQVAAAANSSAPETQDAQGSDPTSAGDSAAGASGPRMPQPIPGSSIGDEPPQQPSSSYAPSYNNYSDVRTASTFGAPRTYEDTDSPSSAPVADTPPNGSSNYTAGDDGAAGETSSATLSDDDAPSPPSTQPPSRFMGSAPPLMSSTSGRYGSANASSSSLSDDDPAAGAGDSATSNNTANRDPAEGAGTNAPPASNYGAGDLATGSEPREFVEPGRAAPATPAADTTLPTETAGNLPSTSTSLPSASSLGGGAGSRFGGGSSSIGDSTIPTPITDSGSLGSLDSLGSESARTPAATLPGRQSVAAAPGPPELEGVQTPSLSIEKIAPAEVQVGRQATFQILVRNVGQVVANDVVVSDRVPQGASLAATSPQASTTDGVLVWRLGPLRPGSEAEVSYTIVPEVEGELGSVAQVTFAAQASARTVSTRPVIKLDVQVTPRVLIGESAAVVITLRNEGTGPARGVVVEEDVPAGLTHPAGRELENTIGTMGPGESRRIELALTAAKPGVVMNMVRVRDDGNLDLIKESPIEVVAPSLDIAVSGPTLRYLERQATHEIAVTNPGTAAARGVQLVAFLPRGLKFVSATKLGQYSTQQHAVVWHLEELPPEKTGMVQMVTLPVEEGEQKLRVESRGDLDVSAVKEHLVRVQSVAELFFGISDSADPIEVGADTTYEIEVTNQGTRADANIVLAAALPDELEPVDASGPTKAVIQGKQIQFEPLAQLGPRERVVFRIRARGSRSGDSRILVQLRSEQAPKPVSKEESTKVYAD